MTYSALTSRQVTLLESCCSPQLCDLTQLFKTFKQVNICNATGQAEYQVPGLELMTTLLIVALFSSVWQWEAEEGQWEPYPALACAQLDSAVSSGEASVSLMLGSGVQYEVDLKKMVQINTLTKYKRKVRSLTLKPGLCSMFHIVCVSEIVKTMVMKGKAPVDSECKGKVGKAHVYCEGSDIYDVMLNQTNLQFNNNKYYLIQLLQDDNAKVYSVWCRWGRVGKVGQNSLVVCGGDLLKAKDLFKKKFLDKTKNEWGDRANFVKVAGKYDMVFMDYSAQETAQPEVEALSLKKPSKLDVKVQSLLELICDIKAMEECVLEMKFDTRKAPLGKLTTEQIGAGYSALKKIEECVKRKGSSRELLEACNLFYTRIPHDFGLRTPPIIRSEEELKEKIALLEALSDIQIAVKMVQSSAFGDEHPLDRQYHSLQCQLQPLSTGSQEYQVIERYLQSTHAPTHSDYTMTVLDIFTVDREGEKNNFLSQLHNRTLLWHGSRLSNWVGILSQGLRVAPPEAPVTGYMFGKGIYFADMSSKSANYCFANQRHNVGLLVLSEVALGDSNELFAADYEAASLPPGKQSTKGLGQMSPDPRNSVMLDGATVPMGPGMRTGVGAEGGYSLLYNEFIVYNPAQTRMKYLLKVQFNYSSLW
uniref:Poly [ADP-ribose] polymerase n=1 Tax=Esox lucius TaxID=8010 RepID=A0A6Q2X1Y3_ESOLU